ncbi:hypothetical protein J7E79_13995 [Bacillus sp. ISL-40]|uniref:hypothetical protein n=1 Tax=unclassified Bacillus (in: firmicutes) TaxID=185979 RepID=UPI001BE6FF00|nr:MULTISPECIES: hypothetical protein [unclassified Bacillus (in: firmicutes)]MBT2698522.1 hypothetical protein [Bacillus sp. ISL-40]MBT2720155.1 hypothetical protein [Bacillus sp. ISL-46]MBT2739252.1 hypothetical protein [Bacillus sp. ISL-77]
MKGANGSNTEPLNYDLNFRMQFTFMADDRTLACILRQIAANAVNLVSLVITKSRNKNNFIRLVAGTSESETSRDLRVVRKTLQSQHITFKEEEIITISNIPAGIPGVFSRFYNSLWCKVEVKSVYLGENDIIFINVSNVKKAVEILSQQNLIPCQNDC